MAHSCRPHIIRKNHHRHHSRNDPSNKLDTSESMLLSRWFYLFVAPATSDDLQLLALVFDVSLGHRHAIRQRIAWRCLRWFNALGANWRWGPVYPCEEVAALCAYYVVRMPSAFMVGFCIYSNLRFLASTHYTNYNPWLFAVNLTALILFAIIPKLPQVHAYPLILLPGNHSQTLPI